jgi:hypothetical protein
LLPRLGFVLNPVTLDIPALDLVLDPVGGFLPPEKDPVVLDPCPPVPPDPVDLGSPASVLDPILDPFSLDSVLNSVPLDPILDPIMDPVALDPDLGPVVVDSAALDPDLDPVPPDPVDLAVPVSLVEAPMSEGPPTPVAVPPPSLFVWASVLRLRRP